MITLILAIVLGQTPEVLSEPMVLNLHRLDGSYLPCLARQVKKGPPNRVGKWVYHAPIPPSSTNDYLGFGAILNRVRATSGMRALLYDQNLSNWATQNNVVQSVRGLGHYVNPNAWQNAGWNYANAQSVMNGWLTSPGHRQTLFVNGTIYGIAYGPGPYWTLNVK